MPGKKVTTPTKSPPTTPVNSAARMTTRSASSPRKPVAPVVITRSGKLIQDESSSSSSNLKLSIKLGVVASGKGNASSAAQAIMTEDETDDEDESIQSGIRDEEDDEDFDEDEVFNEDDEDLVDFGEEDEDEGEEVQRFLGRRKVATTVLAVEEDEDQDEFAYDEEDEREFDNDEEEDSMGVGELGTPSTSSGSLGPRKRVKVDEEDAWIEALEEGRLHEVDDELKKMKDPKLMTARQRALLESKSQKKRQEALRVEEIEVAKKQRQNERLNMDKEAVEQRMMKASKRRQQAEEKKEKDKKQTIDRLLKKKVEKSSDSISKSSPSNQVSSSKSRNKRKFIDVPKISYINNQKGIYLILPENVIPEVELFHRQMNRLECPVVPKSSKELTCARDGCGQRRKYCCATNGLPCCSLVCYKVLNDLPANCSTTQMESGPGSEPLAET